MKIAICDDNHIERSYIKEMINDMSLKSEVTISDFDNGTELINSHNINHYNIILMDVDMPERTGVEIGKLLRLSDSKTILIFITSFPQYAIEAYDCNAFHYILKPVNKTKFEQVLNKAIQTILTSVATIQLHTQKGIQVINVSEIYYVEYLDRKMVYHTKNDSISVKDSVTNILDMLLQYGFCQTHRAFIVNMSKIKKIIPNEAVLDNGKSVMISFRKQKEVERIFTKFLKETI